MRKATCCTSLPGVVLFLQYCYVYNMFSLLVAVTVNVPQVLFRTHDEVVGAQRQFESIPAASMRHEKPLLTHFNSCLHTWAAASKDSDRLFQTISQE